MKLALSNLAIPSCSDIFYLNALRDSGLLGIEVAPTRLAPWDQIRPATIQKYRQMVSAVGLEIPSLQAIFFGLGHLQLLSDASNFVKMLEHWRFVCAIGVDLGAKIAVFGAPRNRNRGDLESELAWTLARERLYEMGEVAKETGFSIGLEPVPRDYGGDFLTQAVDVIQMVREIGHSAIRVHIDTACALLSGDSVATAISESEKLLAHFHASEPKLSLFDNPQCDHVGAASALKKLRYDKWVSIEMLEPTGDSLQSIRQAIGFCTKIYSCDDGKN